MPEGDLLSSDFIFTQKPSKTHKLHVTDDVIYGFTDGLDAVAQAVYLILSIERYEHLIYSWNYGVELCGLFGKPAAFAVPEIKRRITEALLQDSRITSVDNFLFDIKKGSVKTEFTVHSIFGDIETGKEVNI